MKKLLKIVFMLLAIFGITTVAACGENNDDGGTPSEGQTDPNQAIVDQVANEFTFAQTEVSSNFSLVTTAKGGVSISWSSDSSNIVIEGQTATVTQPSFAEGDKEVKLTAVFTLGNATATKTYTVKVLKGENPDTIEALTVAEALASEVGASVTVRGVVSGFHVGSSDYPDSKQGFYLTDTTGTIYVYGYLLAAEVTVGDEIVVSGTKAEYKSAPQISSPVLDQTVSTGNAISKDAAITDKTIADLAGDLTGDYYGKTFIFENVFIDKYDGGSYVSYTLVDSEGNAINLYSGGNGAEFAVFDQYIGKLVDVLYAVNGQNSKGTKWRGHILEVIASRDIPTEEEPTSHIETTIADLVTTKPTDSGKAIYEVTGIWNVDADGSTYGNGKLTDESGNALTIYGFCATNSVVSWVTNQYVFDNDKSYASMGIYNGAVVKVGMVYTKSYDNYSIYLIELVTNGTPTEDGETTTPEVPEGAITLTIADYADTNSWADATIYSSINFDEYTTITSAAANPSSYGQNTGKYYINGENWRIYQNETPSVTITSTKTIASVIIEYAAEKTGTLTLNGEAVASGTLIEVNGTTISFSVGNTGTATNGQARITKITIVYS